MFWWLLLAIILYLLCAILIVAEVFIPSGGLLSVCSLACLAGGIIIFFNFSSAAGLMGVVIAVIMVPSSLILSYKTLPKTRFGRSVTLTPPPREQGEGIPDRAVLNDLMGKQGIVLTPLRPVGICDFDGNRVQCVAESGFIEKSENVIVVLVEGTRVVVALNQKSNERS
ncbi:MAG: hypothetical protein ISS71_01210 [Phycisphaerae bacterium]|nr:hypothetical protein [Phycisphaerae bacterium]